ncbi:OMD protein, partial [Amia calva]|nr:OMD protein [Amia calva]
MLLLGAEVMYQQDYDEPYDSYDFEPEVPPDIEPPAFPHHTDYVNVYVPYPNECARECFCPPSYPFAMYCENRKLKTIPDIPQHIRHLYIQFNEIEAVNAKAFVNATSLRDINLSHNHIKSSMVDRGVFGKLKNLIQLHLDYNNLEEVPAPLPNTLERLFLGFNKISKLSADALQDLAKVTMLDLCNNKLTDAAVKGKILSGMKSLMQINLCNNRLKSMPSDLPASLLQLSLENNSISSIPEGYFKKTPNLMSLRISHNKLKTVPFKVFNLSSLMELNLGHNQLSKAFFIPRALEHLYLNHNEFLATLRRIDLTGNAISEIEDGSFSKLVLLEELSLAENKLVKLPALPAKLTTFNANFNRLRTRGVKANAFKKLINLSYLYLANNELEAVPPQLPESLRILHLHNNNITTITDETFCKGNNTRYIRANMDQIRLDGNPVILAQYPNSFTCLKSLPIGRYY